MDYSRAMGAVLAAGHVVCSVPTDQQWLLREKRRVRSGLARRCLLRRRVLLLLVGWIIGSWLFYLAINPWEDVYVSTYPDQPLYVKHPAFFPPQDFASIRESLVDSGLARTANTLNPGNFGNTSGVVLTFNLKGLEYLRQNPQLAPMARFLDAVRLEDANGFAMNLLMVQSAAVGGEALQQQSGAGIHVDDTLHLQEPFWRQTHLASHQTTVVYLSVPHDMEGGRFVIKPMDYPSTPDRLVKITPEENMVLSFRGDAYHYVEAFRSPSGQSRLSLVVEQYILPPELYKYCPTFQSSADLQG